MEGAAEPSPMTWGSLVELEDSDPETSRYGSLGFVSYTVDQISINL